jgi:hypothetical protein
MFTNTLYNTASPWRDTPLFDGKYLDLLSYISLPQEPDDIFKQIPATYQYRPDLMAYDIYSDANLWWVFQVRNPEIIKDPIWDFDTDKTIYLPKLSTIIRIIGG